MSIYVFGNRRASRWIYRLPLLAAVGCLALPVQAATVESLNSDTDWWSIEANGWTKSFGYQVSEGQGGNWETSIVDGTGNVLAKGQVDWGTDEVAHEFLFSYSPGTTPLLENSTWDTTISYSDLDVDNNPNTIAIRAIERGKNGESAPKADLSDLLLQIGADAENILAGNTVLDGDSDGEYLLITGLDLSSGFTLSGSALFDIGDNQNGFNTAYEVKVGYLQAVPLPGAFWLFGSGLLGLLAFRKRPRP